MKVKEETLLIRAWYNTFFLNDRFHVQASLVLELLLTLSLPIASNLKSRAAMWLQASPNLKNKSN
ncbi:hypothetical protein DPMN_012105 [Dreissena polymorpha]|uniref:Uncharacterized protein n=1 Tax=Dreissena polymorpha TaxID=45954 RepID=A0A9D4N4X2_DREPO|nr:hypothetical protein DPMN_012105 [Dreissena polymorpha]